MPVFRKVHLSRDLQEQPGLQTLRVLDQVWHLWTKLWAGQRHAFLGSWWGRLYDISIIYISWPLSSISTTFLRTSVHFLKKDLLWSGTIVSILGIVKGHTNISVTKMIKSSWQLSRLLILMTFTARATNVSILKTFVRTMRVLLQNFSLLS